ncbi:hypothetical protein FGB62_28g126 [Gracilaria domingensis]|nr:hypothetical protein FGB62_28g126 [Gracilaria domingensis]
MSRLLARATLVYLAGVNTASACLVAYDKYQAAHRGWRVPEKKLCDMAVAGGWAGGILAMYLAHHKTRKKSFQTKYMNAIATNAVVTAPAALLVLQVPSMRSAFSQTFSLIASTFVRRPPPRKPPRFRR